MKPSLTVVGAGIKSCAQMTLEGVRAVAQASTVFSLDVPREALGLLTEFGVNMSKISRLDDLYWDGAPDMENYDRLTAAVESRLSEGKNVCLVVAGHPRVGVTLVSRLERLCFKRYWAFKTIVAPSSFDTIINELSCDPLERGTVLLDANRLLAFKLTLEPAVNVLLYHVCSVANSCTDFGSPEARNRLDLLESSLLRFYSPDKSALWVTSALNDGHSSRIRNVTIGTLAQNAHEADFATSLFIPAEKPRAIDREIVRLLVPSQPESSQKLASLS